MGQNLDSALIRYCIHQSNLEDTRSGVVRLALFLRHTKELVCLFDDVYCTRMWCIWEVATYLRLRENPKITFVSMSLRACGVIAVVVYMLLIPLSIWLYEEKIVCTPEEAVVGKCTFTGNLTKEAIQNWQNYVAFSVWFTSSVILASVGFICGQRHFRSDTKLRSIIANYDIRDAHCTLEDDRQIMLRFVDDLFSEQATSETSPSDSEPRDGEAGLAAFNDYVRTVVPRSGVATSGLRKYKIFSYIVAVLVPLQFFYVPQAATDPFFMFDYWSFSYADAPPVDGVQFSDSMIPVHMQGWMHGSGNGFRYALAFVFDRFIMMPFAAYCFGVHVRLLLALQDLVIKYTGLKYWITVILFLPAFLVLETVCCFRPQIINMIRAVTSFGCIQGPDLVKYTITVLTSAGEAVTGTGQPAYATEFSSVRGVYSLMKENYFN